MSHSQSNKASCVILWEHFYLLCGEDFQQALLLDRLIYLSQQKEQLIDLLHEEQVAGNIPEFKEKVKLDTLRGWVHKSAESLAVSLMCGVEGRTIQRKLDMLEANRFLFKKIDRKGQPASYRPNLRYIEMELEKIGFRLDGSRVIVGAVVDAPETITQDDWWDETPGVDKAQAVTNHRQLSGDEEWRVWVNGNRLLDHAPDHIKRASWLVSQHTGFSPTDKSWIGNMVALWSAAGEKEDILLSALEAGQRARMNAANGLTFKGPRSYVNYAADALAKSKLTIKTDKKALAGIIYANKRNPVLVEDE